MENSEVSMKNRLTVLLATLILLLSAASVMAFGRDPLPEIPPPPPSNMATVQDIAGLKAQIAALQNQILDLMEAVNKQSLAMAKTREVLISVAQAENFEAAKNILNTKYGFNRGTLSAIQSHNAAMMSSAQARIGQIQSVRPQFKANLRPLR
jgi:hypothetical protein